MKYQQDIPRSVISWNDFGAPTSWVSFSYLDLLQRTNKNTLQNHLFKRHQTNQNSPNRCTLFPCKSALQHELQKNISTSFCQCGTTYRSWKTSTSAIHWKKRCLNIFLVLLMEEFLHQLIWWISHNPEGFIHPKWCKISFINRRTRKRENRNIFLKLAKPPKSTRKKITSPKINSWFPTPQGEDGT